MAGIDVNHDGTIDLTLPGASPLHKDLYVEVDAMMGLAPTQATLNRVVTAFAEAPGIYNPDARGGIHLVAALDETTITPAPWTALDGNNWPIGFKTIKQNQSPNVAGGFGTQNERMNANWSNIREAKRQAYRYCIFGVSYGGTTSSGLAELGGNDFMVTLGSNPGWLQPGKDKVFGTPDDIPGTPDQQAGTFMHELGHTLGVQHGGDQADLGPARHAPTSRMLTAATDLLSMVCSVPMAAQLLSSASPRTWCPRIQTARVTSSRPTWTRRAHPS